MQVYVARRLLLFIPTLVGASLMIFVLMRLVPGDIAQILVYQTGSEQSSIQEKQIAKIRTELGLDRPVLVQFLVWLRDAARLDFGESFSQRRPVRDILIERFPALDGARRAHDGHRDDLGDPARRDLGRAAEHVARLPGAGGLDQRSQPAHLLHRRADPLPPRALLPLSAAARVLGPDREPRRRTSSR